MAGFRSSVWDPVLISFQIVSMQCLYWVGFGIWICFFDTTAGTYKSLDQLFSYQTLTLKNTQGKLVMMSILINALTGALALWYIVQRTKQCLDFTMTVHLFHLVACWLFTGLFPNTLTWWLINLISVILMTVLGEFLCMRSELQAIPLSMGPKADL